MNDSEKQMLRDALQIAMDAKQRVQMLEQSYNQTSLQYMAEPNFPSSDTAVMNLRNGSWAIWIKYDNNNKTWQWRCADEETDPSYAGTVIKPDGTEENVGPTEWKDWSLDDPPCIYRKVTITDPGDVQVEIIAYPDPWDEGVGDPRLDEDINPPKGSPVVLVDALADLYADCFIKQYQHSDMDLTGVFFAALIEGYDDAKEQVLSHDAEGILYWLDTGECT